MKNGLYAVSFGGGQVDITSGKYVFQCTEAYKIENGKVGRAGERRHADRQRADRPASHLDDRQRLRARSRHRHLRQERPGRAGRRRPADACAWTASPSAAPLNGERAANGMPQATSRMRGWIEKRRRYRRHRAGGDRRRRPPSPSRYYVPSGSMEPTLLIGDELLATKFPYGYGSASLPAFIDAAQ